MKEEGQRSDLIFHLKKVDKICLKRILQGKYQSVLKEAIKSNIKLAIVID